MYVLVLNIEHIHCSVNVGDNLSVYINHSKSGEDLSEMVKQPHICPGSTLFSVLCSSHTLITSGWVYSVHK